MDPSKKEHQPSRRLGCTHLNMIAIRAAGLACDQCCKIPNTGLLFICEQDTANALYKSTDASRQRLRKGHRRTSMEMELMGFNQSVVKAVANGLYTKNEVETLKRQKLQVKGVIESAIRAKHLGKNCNTNQNDSHHSQQEAQSQSSLQKDNRTSQSCRMKVCPSCRPMARARSYSSLDFVLHNEVALPKVWTQETMPVASATVWRNLGLSKRSETYFKSDFSHAMGSSPSANVVGTTQPRANQMTTVYPKLSQLHRVNAQIDLRRPKDEQQAIETAREDVTLKERPSSLGFRDSIKRGYDDLINEISEQALPKSDTRNSVDGGDGAYEHRLTVWKHLMDLVLEKAASVPLPDDVSANNIEEEYNGPETVDSEPQGDDTAWSGTRLDVILEEAEEANDDFEPFLSKCTTSCK